MPVWWRRCCHYFCRTYATKQRVLDRLGSRDRRSPFARCGGSPGALTYQLSSVENFHQSNHRKTFSHFIALDLKNT
jgi:hypothetical protein